MRVWKSKALYKSKSIYIYMGLAEIIDRLIGNVSEKIKRLSKSALLSAPLLVPYLAPPAMAQCGDCNGDKIVNINDALVAARYGSGIPIPLTPDEFEQCNVVGTYGDQSRQGTTVDVLDALKIALASAGLLNLTCGAEGLVYAERTGNKSEICRIAVDGTNRTPLTQGGRSNKLSPVWSPDGREIAYTDNYGGVNNGLVVMDRDGTNQRNLTPPYFNCFNLSYLNPSTIACQGIDTRLSKSDWDIYKIDLNTLSITQLTSHPEFDINPSCWNGWIVWITNRDGFPNTYRMDENGGSLERVTSGVDVSDIHFNDMIVNFAHRVFWTEQPIWSCQVPNPAGMYQAHTSGNFDRFPCYDGNGRIFFSRAVAPLSFPGYELWRLDLASGQETQITATGRESMDPDYFMRK